MSAVFAGHLARRMRQERVTICELATAMQVPMRRVREVRLNGTPPRGCTGTWWYQDWFDGIVRAKKAQP